MNLLILPNQFATINDPPALRAQLKKIRQVGLDESKKKNFTPNVGKKKKNPPLKPVTQEAKEMKKLKTLSDIKLPETDTGKIKVNRPPRMQVSKEKAQINAQLRNQAYQEKQPHGLIDDVLMKSDFLLKPELPKGVAEDELNSIEKQYFSFQKRMYLQYVNSFISTYNQLKKERPLVKNSLKSGRHSLTARVRFDVEGNIIDIQILKSSLDDDIHQLFEDTLTNIKKVPNPPDDFINTNNEFVIYYALQVN